MRGKYFVSGIDTDAGKTYATGWLAKKLLDEGLKVVTVKFIQTGCIGQSDDILVHRRIMGVEIPEDKELITSPIIMEYPASAHLAAKLEGKAIDLTLIDQAIEQLASTYDVVLTEGAGGLMVPITDDYLTVDYIKSRKMPVILVTNGILGSINHTVLSVEALLSRDIPLTAVIYNEHFDSDKIIADETRLFLQHYIKKVSPSTRWIECPSITKS